MDFAGVVSTAALVNNAIASIKNARELLAATSEPLLRDQINTAYDSLLDLKGRLLDQDDEIRRLKAELERRAAYVGPVAPHGYYYATDDADGMQHPLCPSCYQDGQKIGYMGAPVDWNGGIRRECRLCKHFVYEKEMEMYNHDRKFY